MRACVRVCESGGYDGWLKKGAMFSLVNIAACAPCRGITFGTKIPVLLESDTFSLRPS